MYLSETYVTHTNMEENSGDMDKIIHTETETIIIK